MKDAYFGVYFLLAESLGLVKIGFSDDVVKRVQFIRSSSPVPLKLLGVCYGTRDDERLWHKNYRHLRHYREWFRVDPILIADIEYRTAPVYGVGQERGQKKWQRFGKRSG